MNQRLTPDHRSVTAKTEKMDELTSLFESITSSVPNTTKHLDHHLNIVPRTRVLVPRSSGPSDSIRPRVCTSYAASPASDAPLGKPDASPPPFVVISGDPPWRIWLDSAVMVAYLPKSCRLTHVVDSHSAQQNQPSQTKTDGQHRMGPSS